MLDLYWCVCVCLCAHTHPPLQLAQSYAQVEGVSAGQTSAKASCAMSVSDVLVVNGQGDLGDIAQALFPSLRVPWDTLTWVTV